MPAIEAAKRCIIYGPEFAEHIEDMMKFSLRMVSGVDYEPEDLELVDPDAWGHDYFPSPRFFINWRIPESKDIELLFNDPIEVSPQNLYRFKQSVRDFIRSDVEWTPELDALDYLSMMGSTKTYVDPLKSVANINLRRLKKKFPLDTELKLKYVHVQKSQSEARAAVLASEGSLPLIKLFHKMFKAVSNCPEDKYYDPSVLKGLSGYLTSKTWRQCYLMMDLKKSGLTFNRKLFNALIEVLDDIYPTWNWKRFYNYANAKVFYKGEYCPVTNGFGLGLMDCVVSFTQAVLYRMWCDEFTPFPEGVTSSAKFWSDDSIVKITISRDFGNDDVLEVVRNNFESFGAFMTDYGMSVHSKKPYVSYLGVFLEVYGTDESYDPTKRGQYFAALLSSILASDIAAAKDLFSAVALTAEEINEPDIMDSLDRVTDYWGYEFSPVETGLPFELGGWVYEMRDGFNHLLPAALDIPDNILAQYHGFYSWHLKNMKKQLAFVRTPDVAKRIKEISSIGPDFSPHGHTWGEMVATTLENKVIGKNEFTRLRNKLLSKRKSCFNKSFDLSKGNPFSPFLEFSKTCSTWYMKLPQDLEYFYPRGSLPFKPKASKLDSIRAFYKLTDRYGLSEVFPSSPDLDRCSDQLLLYAATVNLVYENHISLADLSKECLSEFPRVQYAESSYAAYGYMLAPKVEEKEVNKIIDLFKKVFTRVEYLTLFPEDVGYYPSNRDPLCLVQGHWKHEEVLDHLIADYLSVHAPEGEETFESEIYHKYVIIRKHRAEELYKEMYEYSMEGFGENPNPPDEGLLAYLQDQVLGYQAILDNEAHRHTQEAFEIFGDLLGYGDGPPQEEPELGGNLFDEPMEGDY